VRDNLNHGKTPCGLTCHFLENYFIRYDVTTIIKVARGGDFGKWLYDKVGLFCKGGHFSTGFFILIATVLFNAILCWEW